MKTISILLLLFTLPFRQGPMDRLIGDWKVQKLETGAEKLYPTKKEYHLHISETGVTYDLEANGCGTDKFAIDDSTINLTSICTDRCCEGLKDPISPCLDYNGRYKLFDSLLTITNSQGTLYLIKVGKQ